MATSATFFNKLFSLIILIVHLGCFIFTTTSCGGGQHNIRPPSKKRKVSPFLLQPSPSHPNFKTHKPLSSSWTFIKHLFSSKSCKTSTAADAHASPQSSTAAATRSSQQQSLAPLAQPETHFPDPSPINLSGSCRESDISADIDNNRVLPLRNDIFPCTACGEILHKPEILEQHKTTKHAVSELVETDAGHNIVRIIFKSGWPDTEKRPKINRILKIHNSPKMVSKFEEYRETVKANAARYGAVRKRDERCIADGNELMRFHCSTFLCDLGLNGHSAICGKQFCNICEIIGSGFSPKLDGISTLSTTWRAHVAIPGDIEREFGFMNVKRAMLLCRVIAGRVGCYSDEGFDSVVARPGSGVHTRLDEEELLVFNPRAVLPCFVIVYSVCD